MQTNPAVEHDKAAFAFHLSPFTKGLAFEPFEAARRGNSKET